jgi:hypothetical protein
MTILERLNCTDSKIDWNLSDYVMLPPLNKDFELKVGVQNKGLLQRFPCRLSCIACEHQRRLTASSSDLHADAGTVGRHDELQLFPTHWSCEQGAREALNSRITSSRPS